MGREFEYDDSGATTYFFLLSGLSLYLIPATISRFFACCSSDDESSEDEVAEAPETAVKALKQKKQRLKAKKSKPWLTGSNIFFAIAWLAFIFMAYQASTFEVDAQYDPFEILGLSYSATNKEIKSKYRKLSLEYHPDRNQDDPDAEAKFIRIAKAYKALTDEDTRRNWEEYGNPDGPGEKSFGIALPSWIVSEDNKYGILMIYTLLLVVVLPICVFWYSHQSKQLLKNQLLESTIQLFVHFMDNRTKKPKDVLEVLSIAHEFRDADVTLKTSTPQTVDKIARQAGLPDPLGKGKKAWRFSGWTYAVAARVLFQAHLTRVKLPHELQIELEKALERTPMLIHALVEACVVNRRQWLTASINCMKTSQLLVQACPDTVLRDELTAVPELHEKAIKLLLHSKPPIRTIQELFINDEDTIRARLKSALTTEQLDTVMFFGRQLPFLEVEVRLTTEADQAELDTIGGECYQRDAVRLTYTLRRCQYDDWQPKAAERVQAILAQVKATQVSGKGKRKNNKGKPAKKGGAQKPSESSEPAEEPVAVEAEPSPTADAAETPDNADNDANDDNDDNADEASDGSEASEAEEDIESVWADIGVKPEEQEEEEEVSLTKAYCPHYPLEKEEVWWMFLGTPKHKGEAVDRIDTIPQRLSIGEEVTGHFLFPTPEKACTWSPNLYLVCDSYIGMDVQIPLRLVVRGTRPPPPEVDEPIPEELVGESDTEDSDEEASDEEDW
eukprot:m.235407 g.235407  ORF g.235407 m.235407 type:complete len:729 (-) comp17403_c0_seq2:3841-6027(-)